MRAWVLILAGCSSTSSGGSQACKVEGTYLVDSHTTSGDCPERFNERSTYTIAKTASGYELGFQGMTGTCGLEAVDGCKFQAKCDLSIADPVDPSTKGTLQFSWTFSPTGFQGTVAISIPPAKSLPSGCHGTSSQQSARQ